MYMENKRSFAYSFSGKLLDPVLYAGKQPLSVRLVIGRYGIGSNVTMAEIARGGTRFAVRPQNTDTENFRGLTIENLNLARAQEDKHGDIGESGSKSVIYPFSTFVPSNPRELSFFQVIRATLDFYSGILDLIIPCESIVNWTQRETEYLFFGPDENTSPIMSNIARYAKSRGYKYWRAMTSGKLAEIGGIAHDTFGITKDGLLFGISSSKDGKSLELMLDGEIAYNGDRNLKELKELLGEISISGMTTTSVLTAYRELLHSENRKEEDEVLFMAGGPDGDLGANCLQSFKGNYSVIVNGTGVLYMPSEKGFLSKEQLLELSLDRRFPRKTLADYDTSDGAIFVPRRSGRVTMNDFQSFFQEKSEIMFSLLLQQSVVIPKGQGFSLNEKYVHLSDQDFLDKYGAQLGEFAVEIKSFLNKITDEESTVNSIYSHPLLADLEISSFITNGGRPETLTSSNIEEFVKFTHLANPDKKLLFVEGANIFITTEARNTLIEKGVKVIRDIHANKGGVYSSSIGEILPSLILTDAEFESHFAEQSERGIPKNRVSLIKDTIGHIEQLSKLSTRLFIKESQKLNVSIDDASKMYVRKMDKIQRQIEDSGMFSLDNKEIILPFLNLIVPNSIKEFLDDGAEGKGLETIYSRLMSDATLQKYLKAHSIKKLASIFVYLYGVSEEPAFTLNAILPIIKNANSFNDLLKVQEDLL
jgi:glutamate dehydrogenase